MATKFHLSYQELNPTSLLAAQQTVVAVVQKAEEKIAELEGKIMLLEKLAFTDQLTKLMNRIPIVDFLDREMEATVSHELRAPQDGVWSLGVLEIDLRGFKLINDTLGHAEGDRALLHTADVLQGSIRKKDRAARWGGDEFLVALENVDHESIGIVIKRILSGIRAFRSERRPFEHCLDARIGGVIWTREMGVVPSTSLIEAADAQERWMKRQCLSGACVVDFKKETPI